MDDKCFAFRECHDGSTVCICLENPNCPGYAACAFYKPRWKYKQGKKMAYKRLSSLPEERQMHIAETYYKGKMPWREKPTKKKNSGKGGRK